MQPRGGFRYAHGDNHSAYDPLVGCPLGKTNACVSVQGVMEAIGADPNLANSYAAVMARTMWHSLYDQQAGGVEFSFYLGEGQNADGSREERRSEYLRFALE